LACLCAATVLIDEGFASPLDNVRAQLIEHVKSGAKPDPNLWSRYVASYQAAQPKQEAKVVAEIPKLKWHQSKSKLAIVVLISGAKNDKVEFKEDSIEVTGVGKDGKHYELILPLFKTIKTKGSSFTVDNKGIYLTMRKTKKESYWARLTKVKPTGKLKRAIEVDWANWVDEDDLPEESDDDIDEDDVKILDDNNFDSWVSSQKAALVEFYAPWCGHCKALKGPYAKAATSLREQNSVAKLAKLDASKWTKVANRFGISGYPTLKVFRGGKLKGYEYKGENSAESITQYMLQQGHPSMTNISPKAVKDYVAGKTVFVGFFAAGSPKTELLSEVADDLREDFGVRDFSKGGAFGLVEGDASSFGVEGKDQVVLFKSNGEQITYPGQLDSTEVDKFLLLNTLPAVGDLSMEPHLEEKYERRDLPKIVLFVDPNDPPAEEALMAAATSLSKDLHGKYSIVRYGSDNKEKMTSLGIQTGQIPDPKAVYPEDWSEEDDGPWEAPQVDDLSAKMAIDEAGGKVHYVLPADKEATLDNIRYFVGQHTSCLQGVGECELKKAIKSEAPPASNADPVRVVVGETFEEIVMDEKKDVLVEFYAPWCGHCKKLTPIYDRLGEKVKKTETLTIAKMDATANDIPHNAFKVDGFPTIYFKAAGKSPVPYDGPREVSGFITFLKKEATHPILD